MNKNHKCLNINYFFRYKIHLSIKKKKKKFSWLKTILFLTITLQLKYLISSKVANEIIFLRIHGSDINVDLSCLWGDKYTLDYIYKFTELNYTHLCIFQRLAGESSIEEEIWIIIMIFVFWPLIVFLIFYLFLFSFNYRINL